MKRSDAVEIAAKKGFWERVTWRQRSRAALFAKIHLEALKIRVLALFSVESTPHSGKLRWNVMFVVSLIITIAAGKLFNFKHVCIICRRSPYDKGEYEEIARVRLRPISTAHKPNLAM